MYSPPPLPAPHFRLRSPSPSSPPVGARLQYSLRFSQSTRAAVLSFRFIGNQSRSCTCLCIRGKAAHSESCVLSSGIIRFYACVSAFRQYPFRHSAFCVPASLSFGFACVLLSGFGFACVEMRPAILRVFLLFTGLD